MSKKTRPHRSAPAAQAAPEETEADAIVRRVLGDLWKAVAAGEPLQAEIEASTCMEIPRVLGVRDAAEEEQFRATVLVEGAVRRGNPDGAALLQRPGSTGLRLMSALGMRGSLTAVYRSFAVFNLDPSATYTYTVRARDENGNLSPMSEPRSVTVH